MSEEDSKPKSGKVRRRRTKKAAAPRTRSAGGPTRIVLWATLAVLAWAPMPYGSTPDWAAALLACLTALLLMGWCIAALVERPAIRIPWVVWPAALLVAGVMAWSFMQAMPGLPAAWHHPVWGISEAAALNTAPIVGLEAEAGRRALMRFSIPVGMFALGLLLGQRDERARLIFNTLLAMTAAYALFGILQEVIGARLTGSAAYHGNVVSTFVNRNHFATFANIGAVIALGLLIEPALHGRQGGERLRTALARAMTDLLERRRMITFALFVLVLAMLASRSRGGLLSLALAAPAMVMIGLAARGIRTRTTWLSLLAVVVGGVMLVSLGGVPLLERFGQIEAIDANADVNSRLSGWLLTLDAIAQRPWLGHGHGAFETLFFLNRDPRFPQVWDHAHNDYLELAAELGLPAAAALLTALLLLVLWCLRGVHVRRLGRVQPLIALGAALVVGLHALVDFSLSMPAIAALFAFILGVGCVQSERRHERGGAGRGAARPEPGAVAEVKA